MSGLVSAASSGNLALVESELDQGANIEVKDSSGDTALNEAARLGRLEVVRLLINRGAKLHSPNNGGGTALTYAQKNGYPEIVQLLQEAAEKAKQPSKEWVLMAEDVVSYVRTYPKQLRKITEVFNFESRERMIISENIMTKAESIAAPASFDELPQARLEQAFEQLTQLGGAADKDFVLRGTTRLDKSKPGRE